METSHLTLWEKIKLVPWMIVLWIGYKLTTLGDKIMGDK